MPLAAKNIVIAGVSGFAVVIAGLLAFTHFNKGLKPAPASGRDETAPRAVACLGRVVPGEGVVLVSAPASEFGPALVKQLHVHRGERVQTGQLLATLNLFDLTLAQTHQAEAEVLLASNILAQVQAGEKTSTIAAQEAVIGRLTAELANARVALRRTEKLFQEQTISRTDFELAQLAAKVAEENVAQAQQFGQSLKEVRRVDVAVAESRVQTAQAALRRAQVAHAQSRILSPITGTVLEIQTFPGEAIGTGPLLRLGETDRMRVEAEVYVTDISRVRLGAPAIVKGDGFAGALAGKVVELGQEVAPNVILPKDPSAFADWRVVKVRIELEDGAKVRSLNNTLVNVVIQP